MIARLRGVVVDSSLTHIVLDVGGVGYLVAVRAPSDFKLDSEVALHTYLAVRENALDLYGFETRDELEMFEHLLKLPKIGPKSGMQIMSQADIELLKRAIASSDPSYLSKMSGIGKKSAEKIVQGLKDVFEYPDTQTGATGSTEDADVIDALMTLGYTRKDALDTLQKISPETKGANRRVEEALRIIGS